MDPIALLIWNGIPALNVWEEDPDWGHGPCDPGSRPQPPPVSKSEYPPYPPLPYDCPEELEEQVEIARDWCEGPGSDLVSEYAGFGAGPEALFRAAVEDLLEGVGTKGRPKEVSFEAALWLRRRIDAEAARRKAYEDTCIAIRDRDRAAHLADFDARPDVRAWDQAKARYDRWHAEKPARILAYARRYSGCQTREEAGRAWLSTAPVWMIRIALFRHPWVKGLLQDPALQSLVVGGAA